MRTVIARVCGYAVGLALVIYSVGSNLLAGGPAATPEIDGGSISTGLGLLTAAVLLLRSRRRSK